MPTRERTKNALIVGNLSQVFANKEAKQRLTFRIKGKQECCYVVGQTEVPEAEIETKFPVAFKPIRNKGENIDSTKFD